MRSVIGTNPVVRAAAAFLGDHRAPDIEQPGLMLGSRYGRAIVDLVANRRNRLRHLG